MRGVKWYHRWWVYALIAIIFLLLGAIIFRERENTTEKEMFKTEIDILTKQTKSLDSLYRVTAAEKEKIRIIREKIDITQDVEKLKKLIKELEEVKATPIKRNSTTIELKQYLETEFK